LWNREADLLRLGVGGLVIAASLLLTQLAMTRRPALAGR
jgi:hypothetical protein